MKTILNKKEKYIVSEVIEECSGVKTLKLLNKKQGKFTFFPGQFITVYFPELNTPEGKSYSISSDPDEKTLNITVKAIGEFSKKLCSMRKGDEITISPPYGFFYSENTNKDMVIIAGGIGVAPFRGIIRESLKKYAGRKIILNVSNRDIESIIFKKEFENLRMENKNLIINNYITRQNDIEKGMSKGRIDVEKFLKKNIDAVQNSEFFICGSISFVRDMWRDLTQNGVPEEVIYTEAFFSH